MWTPCAFITDSNLLITSDLAGIHIVNTAAPVCFSTHLSDRWRNVDVVQILPLELFCALNPTVPACSCALCCSELSWLVRGAVQPLGAGFGPSWGCVTGARVREPNHQNYCAFLSDEPSFL